MNRVEIQSTIRKLIDQLGKTLRGWVKRAQASLFERIARIIDKLESEGGRITRSAANTNLQGDVAAAVTKSQNALLAQLLPWLIRNVKKLVSLNGDFYATRETVGATVRSSAVRQVLLSLGYDNKKKKVVEGTYIDSLGGSGLKQQILSRVSSAIMGKSSISGFRASFRKDFIGGRGLGLVEKQFNLLSRNLFAQVERTASLAYAENLGFTHAVYGHTLKNNTRPFCRARMNRIYTIQEIRSWDAQDWKGKITGVPAEVQQGGHNCRGNYRWMTKTLAETLAKRRGQDINSYN